MMTNSILSKQYLVITCFTTILFLVSACNNKSDVKSDKVTDEIHIVSDKTQALLLTQPFDYDASDKNKITGDYISQSKIIVPQNLATQSKWIMFEGPVLENDLVAYRYYADSRHRFDIYGKLVNDLVMDTVSWKYHDIMDWGSDILKVGNSLGMGTPAIYYNDSLYTLSVCDKKEIQVLENGGDRSTIRTIFTGLSVADQKIDLIQDWSLAAGQPWSEISLEVLNGKLPDGMRFATGFVKHIPEIIRGTSADMFYAMNWGNQSYHEEGMGMAVMADTKYQPKTIKDEMSHAYLFENADTELTYQFVSVWERDKNNVKDEDDFMQLINSTIATLK